ncbi:acyl-CoA dehydrogenase [Spectribacter hydrogenoxidans]|uniref:Acyl-CoA dehydrogenase n=1 Tax=Spectribacter hydrogenoxidans TaxID=3075608 RepID=A0ABU3C0F5_9GAMM|nr:acyl-CoA dehydrogenase [Salinisphaera sp. W335]MDT0635037.1 acyl-CoA dehydrogenase [Salinisphaera sp. W335]
MSDYHAPVRDMLFVMTHLADAASLAELPGYEEATPDLLSSVLDEAGRFGSECLAPLNQAGDRDGARWTPEGVLSSPGFADAYADFVAGGWNGLTATPDSGGMGLPTLMGSATHEIWNAANMAFALCPLLSASAIKLLENHGDEALTAAYLEKMVSGEWTGTMDLTEPQSGSDLATIRTRAEPAGDGSYRLFGQKIYITWGEHDMAANTIHLVLARLPDAPAGVKGISLFLVPRYLLDDNGEPGAANDMRAASIEHKLGIHGSPTCTMVYGEADGAVGYLVGPENQGLRCMFTMMNAARHKMGVQALGLSDRAYQRARAYAFDRVQGRPADPEAPASAPIAHHADVRRMLLLMKSQIDAMRALCYVTAADMDRAGRAPEAEDRRRHQARVDLLIPVVKAWCTEVAIEITSLGVQVHGGMGYVEETGAAQYYRDARIIPIYEGTNGIQAIDLVGRKLLRDQGEAMQALIADMSATRDELAAHAELGTIRTALSEGIEALGAATESLLEAGKVSGEQATANAFDYLMLVGTVTGGWLLARQAMVASDALDKAGDDRPFYEQKVATATFYAAQVMPRLHAHARVVANGFEPVLSVSPAMLAAG